MDTAITESECLLARDRAITSSRVEGGGRVISELGCEHQEKTISLRSNVYPARSKVIEGASVISCCSPCDGERVESGAEAKPQIKFFDEPICSIWSADRGMFDAKDLTFYRACWLVFLSDSFFVSSRHKYSLKRVLINVFDHLKETYLSKRIVD